MALVFNCIKPPHFSLRPHPASPKQRIHYDCESYATKSSRNCVLDSPLKRHNLKTIQHSFGYYHESSYFQIDILLYKSSISRMMPKSIANSERNTIVSNAENKMNIL